MAQDRVLFTAEYKKDRNSETFKKMVWDLCCIVCSKAPPHLRSDWISHVYIKILEKWDDIQPDAGRGDVWGYYYQYIYNQFRTGCRWFYSKWHNERTLPSYGDNEHDIEPPAPPEFRYMEEEDWLEELRDGDDYLMNCLIEIMNTHDMRISSAKAFTSKLFQEFGIIKTEEEVTSIMVKICWNMYVQGSRNKYLINFILAKITLAEICSIWRYNCANLLGD